MKPMEDILLPNTTNSTTTTTNNNNLLKPSASSSSSFEKRVKPQKAACINCPRCDSTNTKFCYYNNYSLSQPRYFCKTCRRYWTEGGTLRNIPVGGGSRKNKRSSTSSSIIASSSYSSKKFPDLVVPSASTAVLSQNPRIHHDQYGQDLNLGFSTTNTFKNFSEFLQAPNFDVTRNMISIPDPNSVYTPMIPLPELKIPSLGFSGVQESNSGRLLFPFEELKTDTSASVDDGGQSKYQNCDSNGFWNGMMGGSSWI